MAKMTKSQLFMRCLEKVMNEKITKKSDPNKTPSGDNTGLVKFMKIPVQFNNQGEWCVANLIFQSTINPSTGMQDYKEVVEVYPNIARKEEQKTVMEVGSFLYELRPTNEEADILDGVRKELKKAMLFGKREINAAVKEAAKEAEPTEEVSSEEVAQTV